MVLDKHIPFTTTLIPVTQSTIDNKYLVQVLLVNCENSSKSVKPYKMAGQKLNRVQSGKVSGSPDMGI